MRDKKGRFRISTLTRKGQRILQLTFAPGCDTGELPVAVDGELRYLSLQLVASSPSCYEAVLEGLTPLREYLKERKDAKAQLMSLRGFLVKEITREGRRWQPLLDLQYIFVDENQRVFFVPIPMIPQDEDLGEFVRFKQILGETIQAAEKKMRRANGREMTPTPDSPLFPTIHSVPDPPTHELSDEFRHSREEARDKARGQQPIGGGRAEEALTTQPLDGGNQTPPLQVGVICELGDIKKTNQDRVVVRTGTYGDTTFGLFLVADGMGGLAHGEVASTLVSERVLDWYDNVFVSSLSTGELHNTLEQLDETIYAVNREIISYSQEVFEQIGTTLTLCLVVGKEYIIRHIGDSRVYYFNPLNKLLSQLTMDHSLVAMELAKGIITEEEAKNHPRKNVLTQCVGVRDTIDLFRTSGEFDAANGLLLVCSDGFHNFFDWTQFGQMAGMMPENPQLLAEQMRNTIPYKEAKDNISCILVVLT